MSEPPPELAAILEAVRREDRAEALRLSLEAWRAGVVHPLVLMLAAEALQAAGEGAQAVALLERALDLTDEPEIWRRYGVALLGQERATDAVAAFEEALDIEPRDIQALALAGRASFQSGEFVAADGYYERALALDPLNPEVLARRGGGGRPTQGGGTGAGSRATRARGGAFGPLGRHDPDPRRSAGGAD